MDTTFIDELASAAPTPGGGGAAAYVGALASALASMVGNLTVGKSRYADVEDEVRASLSRLEMLRARLVALVDEDARAFEPLAAAYRLPKATPEEQAARKAAMEEGLKEAAQVPMEVAETVASLFPALETVVLRGNPNAVTDGMVGAMLARTAVLGALFNVRVNLDSIHDSHFTAALAARADAAQELALSWEKRILSPIALAGTLS